MRQKIYSQKTIAGAMLIALISVSAIGFNPRTTFAFNDPGDTVSVPISNNSTDATTFTHSGQSLWGIPIPYSSLDSIWKLFVHKMIEQLQQSVVGWVTGGRDGSPMFETNLYGFVNSVSQDTGKKYLSNLGNDQTQVCGYFKNDVVRGLSQMYSIPVLNSTSNSVCDVEAQIGQDNVRNFVQNNDFAGGGGWNTWSAITQNMDANPMGAFLNQQDRLNTEISKKVAIEREKIDQGNGFHSQEDSYGNVITPGAIIQDQIKQVLSSDLRQLEQAKTWDDIITSLADTMANKVISDGLASAGKSNDNNNIARQYAKPTYNRTGNTSTTGTSIGGTTQTQLQNVSINGTASQSSVLVDGDGNAHDASIALTGNKNRNPKFGGVSITKDETNPWWQVTLNGLQPIDHIDITPRIDDGFGTDLTGFYVIVSANPITGSAIPTAGPGVWVSPRITPANPRSDITTVTPPNGTIAQYVRIQLDHSGRLELAGVQVFAKNIPVLSLVGDNPMTVNRNQPFQDPGAVAMDKVEGDITDRIVRTGSVNTAVSGTYEITYSVTNAAGVPSGSLTRKVIVK